jgi:hypothetical protein
MQTEDEAFWGNMGITWRASMADPRRVSAALETRLRRQAIFLRTLIILTVLGAGLGLAIAAWTLWLGWREQVWNFMARGVTILTASVLALIMAQVLGSRSKPEVHTLQNALRLSVSQAERLIRVADFACITLAIFAVGGTAGYVLRVRSGHPPAVPVLEDLLVLALAGIGVLVFRAHQNRRLRAFRHLSQAFE